MSFNSASFVPEGNGKKKKIMVAMQLRKEKKSRQICPPPASLKKNPSLPDEIFGHFPEQPFVYDHVLLLYKIELFTS